MKGMDNIAIQNLHGRLTQLLSLKKYMEIPLLFLEDGTFEMPDDGIELKGREQISQFYSGITTDAKGKEWFLSHTPAIKVDDKENIARASWYVSTVKEEDSKVIQGSARFDADLEKVDGKWYYSRLQFYYMMTLLPEEAVLLQPERALEFDIPAADMSMNPEDYVDIVRLVGRWSHNQQKNWNRDFCREELTVKIPGQVECTNVILEELISEYDKVLLKAKDIYPYPMSVPMLTSPLVTIDGNYAKATWLVIRNNTIKDDKSEEVKVAHWLETLYAEFVKEKDAWKIKTLIFEDLYRLPDNVLDVEASKTTMSGMDDPWINAPEPIRHDREAAEEVLLLEEYISFWVSGLRYRSEAPFYYERWALERPDILEYCVGIREQRLKRGIDDITKEIFAMVSKFSTLQPKAPGNHIGSTPVIEISEDGNYAHAVWLDYGWTTAAEVFGITKAPYFANPAIARYEHKYIKIDGKWKLYSFHWLPFYRLSKWLFDYDATKGWSGTTSTKRFPLPREEYIYENDPEKKGIKIKLDPPIIDCPYETVWTGPTDKI